MNGQAVTTTYTYNSLGQVLTVTDALSHVTTNTYDTHGNLTSVLLVDETSSKDGITVRIRNKGKFAISRVQLNCVVRGSQEPMRCRENTPMFFPGTDYTATFYYPRQPRSVTLSIKQLAMSDGTIYKPRRADRCQTLAIAPPKIAKKRR